MIIGMPVKIGTVAIGHIPVTMRPYDSNQFHGIFFFSSMRHVLNESLKVLIIVVRGVDLISYLFDLGDFIIMFSNGFPLLVVLSLSHDRFESFCLLSGF